MDAIKSLKKKKRKLKTPRRQTPYRYIVATDQNLAQFLRGIRLFEEAQVAKEEELEQLEKEQKELEQQKEQDPEESETNEESEQNNEEEKLKEEGS